jgi:integrase
MLTFIDKIETYLSIIKDNVKPATWSSYKSYLDSNIAPYFKETPYSEITSESLSEFFGKLIEDGISPITIKPIRAFLNRAIRYDSALVTTYVTDVDPAKRELRYYSREEQRALQNAAIRAGYPLAPVIYLGLYTGMRVGEVSGLEWGDIDFEKKTVSISRNIQRLRSPDSEKKTKLITTYLGGTSSLRTISLAQPLLDILEQYKDAGECEYVAAINRKPLEPRYIQNHFRLILDSAGMDHVNFNVLRDTFAVRAIEAGFNLISLSKVLGHGSTIMTADRYARFFEQDMDKLMENFSENAVK